MRINTHTLTLEDAAIIRMRTFAVIATQALKTPVTAAKPKSWPWHWLIFLPVLASVVAGLTTLAIAIRHGDQPLPELITKTGPVQYGNVVGIAKARERGVLASAQFTPDFLNLTVAVQGHDLPAQLELRFWHPTEASRDVLVELVRGDDGRYHGTLGGYPSGLNALLSAPAQGWEVNGSWVGSQLSFTP